MTSLSTTPSRSISRNRVARTFDVIVPMSRRKSPKRRGPSQRYQRTFGVHAPASSRRHTSSGQSWGGGVLMDRCLFIRGLIIYQVSFRNLLSKIFQRCYIPSCGSRLDIEGRFPCPPRTSCPAKFCPDFYRPPLPGEVRVNIDSSVTELPLSMVPAALTAGLDVQIGSCSLVRTSFS